MRYDAKIHLDDGTTLDAELTTDHAASSHGLPVVTVKGLAMGPADLEKHYGHYVLEVRASEFARSPRQLAERAGYRCVRYP